MRLLQADEILCCALVLPVAMLFCDSVVCAIAMIFGLARVLL